jgi:hypothetical protein
MYTVQNNKNLNFTGSAKTNAYGLIQNGGKRRKSRKSRKSRRKTRKNKKL